MFTCAHGTLFHSHYFDVEKKVRFNMLYLCVYEDSNGNDFLFGFTRINLFPIIVYKHLARKRHYKKVA